MLGNLGNSVVRNVGAMLEKVRDQEPHVHCLTNNAAAEFTANSLLAIHAIPSLTDNAAELTDFVCNSDALLINLGTPDAEKETAYEKAITAIRTVRKPWVLDPVFVDKSPLRADWARRFLAAGPNVVRLNKVEAGELKIDVEVHSNERDMVVAVTGKHDRIVGPGTALSIENGHPLMRQVTAMGCALGAITGAFLAVDEDAFQAVFSAHLCFAIAGEIAVETSAGPGSFRVNLLDALYALTPDIIVERARVV